MKANLIEDFMYFHHDFIIIIIAVVFTLILPFLISKHSDNENDGDTDTIIVIIAMLMFFSVLACVISKTYFNNKSNTITATYLYRKDNIKSKSNESNIKTVYYFKANNQLLKINSNQLPEQDSHKYADSNNHISLNLQPKTRIKVKFKAFRDAKGKIHDVKVDTLSYSTKDKTTPNIPNKKFDFNTILK